MFSEQPPPSSAEELLVRYAEGERRFSALATADGQLVARTPEGEVAHMIGPRLREANLKGANLSEAQLWVADLSLANLERANLERAILFKANLTGANLVGADLSRALMTDAEMVGAHLAGANLTRADLTGAVLRCADLSGANLEQANLIATDLRMTKLSGAQLDGANLLYVGFDHTGNLLDAEWTTLKFDSEIYYRERVERGEQILPVAQPNPLRFVFQTVRPLTGDELAATSELVRVFGSMKNASRLMFQIVEAGHQLVVESHKDPQQAVQIALGVLRHSHKDPSRNTVEQILQNQRWQAARDGVMARRLETLLETLQLVEVKFPNEQLLEDFVELTTKAGVSLGPAPERVGRRVLRAGKSMANSPAVAGLTTAALTLLLADPIAASLLGKGAEAIATTAKEAELDDEQ